MTARALLRGLGLLVLTASVTVAQDTVSPGWGQKRIITYSGTLRDATGTPRFGTIGMTLSLYPVQEGGEPLWRESQTIQTDDQGRYTVLLGETEQDGLPLEVFTDRKAQWLGVQPQGEAEQPRILLLSVPYALKAADADTVGGKPLSSFVLYEDLAKVEEKARSAAVIVAQASGSGASGGGARQAVAGSSGTAPAVPATTGSTGRVLSSEVGTNTWFGLNAGAAIGGGAVSNSLFGYNAGNKTTDGDYNSFLGAYAGFQNTTGAYNTFVGISAGYSNTTASDNTIVGALAGYSNTSSYNSFFGSNAGFNNTNGVNNAFFGYGAGNANSVGGGNSFFGHQSGYSNTASNNSFFGSGAGFANTTGSSNAFFGTAAGFANTGGSYNSALGRRAGEKTTLGLYNTFLGYLSGMNNTTGWDNLFAGYSTGSSNTTEDYNSFIGDYSNGVAGITNATAVGYRAQVNASNSLVLGSINGINGATADTNVGIGTTTPSRLLEVRKDQAASTYLQVTNANDTIDASRSRFSLVAGTVTQEMQSIAKDGGYFGTTSNHPFRIYTNRNTRMTIDASGNVGINTLTPTERLHVVGNIRFTGTIINSAPDENLPDYVFEPDYPLMTVEQLAAYVAKEKHLPNVPSAAEVKENGLNLVQFQARLLEKIEELTLYAVQQGREHKTAMAQKDGEISTLESRVAVLEQLVQRLTLQGLTPEW